MAGRYVPPAAHERMKMLVPATAGLVGEAAGRYRAAGATVVTQDDLHADDRVMGMLEAYVAALAMAKGRHLLEEAGAGDMLAAHLYYMVNLELHRRKLFWVDESLAWMLANTRLDIQGRYLRLPFACCGFVFNDPMSLEMARDIMRLDPDAGSREPAVVSAYVMEVPAPAPSSGISVYIAMDDLGIDWPYLVGRELLVGPEDDLESILESHFPELATEDADPLFRSGELERLVHLVLNAVMYATTAHLDEMIIESPLKGLVRAMDGKKASGRKRLQGRLERRAARTSGEDVYFLPGKIEISRLRQMQRIERSEGGRSIMKRFMVRGHWRGPNPGWKDRRLRWIEPYWKGPELAAIIEREYRMKP